MIGSAIRHLATSLYGERIGAALFEKSVSIYSLNNGNELIRLNTCLDFGGRRLAFSPDNNKLAVGSFSGHLELYDAETGALLWKRNRMKDLQFLSFSNHNFIFVGLDKSSILVNVGDGSTILTKQGITEFYPSERHKELAAFFSRKKREIYVYDIYKDKEIVKIPIVSFAILDISFFSDYVFFSEVGIGLKCFNYKENKLIWNIALPEKSQFGELGYSQNLECLFAVLYLKPNTQIYSISPLTGDVLNIFTINGLAAVVKFCSSNDKLITSDGELIEFRKDGQPEITKRFTFPETRYAD